MIAVKLERTFARAPSRDLPGGNGLTQALNTWVDWLFYFYMPALRGARPPTAMEQRQAYADSVYQRMPAAPGEHSDPTLDAIVRDERFRYGIGMTIHGIVGRWDKLDQVIIFMHANSSPMDEIIEATGVKRSAAFERISRARFALETALAALKNVNRGGGQ